MIIFLYGPDDYRRIQKKRDLIAEFKKKRSDFGLEFFDLEDKDSPPRFEAFARNQPLFASAKLAVLEHAFELEATALAKILKPFIKDEVVKILIAEHDKPLKALSFLIEKPTISQKFEHLAGAEWIAFIKDEAKRAGTKLTESAAQFLGTVYQGSSWALVTELQKLSSLKSVIDKKDLDALDLEAAPNYWALLNGVKSYDVKSRLFALEKLFATNDPPAKLFNILASQWQEKIPRFAEFDFAIKSGKLDYEEALLELIL